MYALRSGGRAAGSCRNAVRRRAADAGGGTRADVASTAAADGRAVALGLAPIVVKEIFAIIARTEPEGVTIFLVEQNAHLALQVAHHFYLMEQGRVTFSGNPGELAEDEVIKRAYLGTRRSAG